MHFTRMPQQQQAPVEWIAGLDRYHKTLPRQRLASCAATALMPTEVNPNATPAITMHKEQWLPHVIGSTSCIRSHAAAAKHGNSPTSLSSK